MASYDVVVVGLGAMGSAAAYACARRGLRVLGVDRFHPPHEVGSSHGRSRIIRLAYMEAPAYVPLLRRSWQLWRRLERSSGRPLLLATGGLMLGSEHSQAVSGSLASAREHDLPHELLDATAIRRRFPALHPTDSTVALYERNAGVLFPEEAVAAFLESAAAHGAMLRFDAAVTGWSRARGGLTVRLAGARVSASALLLTAGPWLPELTAIPSCELRVTRQVMQWIAPAGGIGPFLPERFPIYIWEIVGGSVFYGFPALDGPDGGVKAALHDLGCPTAPDRVERSAGRDDAQALRAALRGRIPALDRTPLRASVCLYTNTPDGHFLLGPHPQQERVWLAGGMSGHGFKFAPVVGEILADFAAAGGTDEPIAPFAPDRFRR